jgi:hypothetical protein
MPESIDQLNVLHFRQYFNSMDITKEQKEERIKLAEEIEEDIFFLFDLIAISDIENDFETIIQNFKQRYKRTISNVGVSEDWIEKYIPLFAKNTLETTKNRIDDEYYLSNDRAVLIAENEATEVYNASDYFKAIKQGKTRKRWLDLKDNRERKSHLLVGGTTIPIREYFKVGSSYMLYPHDTVNGDISQTANCRCSILYL